MSGDPQRPPGLVAADLWLGQIRAAGIEPDQAAIDYVTAFCHWERPCSDCGAEIGSPHDHGCDIERCMWTGNQWIACGGTSDWDPCACEEENGYDPHGYTIHTCGQVRHDCGSQIWDGMWPGTLETVKLGVYSYFDRGWYICGPEHPAAVPDYTLMLQICRWDRAWGTNVPLAFAADVIGARNRGLQT